MILYIGNDNIYLFDKNFSKIFYKAHKNEINYSKLISSIGKNSLYVFVNSFFCTSEHKTFPISAKKQDIKNFIEDRFSKPDVVFADYNYLFKNGEGSVHKKDIIMTVIKNSEQELHMKKIMNELIKTDLNLSHIYSFDQTVNTLGLSFSALNLSHCLNVNVFITEDSVLITTSNYTNYMFGRLIKKRNNESITKTAIKMLIMTLKYIGTTYSFLQSETKVSIFSVSEIDVDKIKLLDPVFDATSINSNVLKMPKLKIEQELTDDIAEIQLLNLAICNVKYIANLTNSDISLHMKIYKFIKIFRVIAIGLLFFSIIYGLYRYATGTQLSNSDKEVEKHYVKAVQDVRNGEKKLIGLDDNVYAIISTNFEKNAENNSHMDCLKSISNILRKHRKLFFVESYTFEHNKLEHGNSNVTKKNVLYIDFALFNINSSAKFVVNELLKIETEIKEKLSKIGYETDVSFQKLSHDKYVANSKDVRDTMIITFQKSVL